jgi:hypothetical protein
VVVWGEDAAMLRRRASPPNHQFRFAEVVMKRFVGLVALVLLLATGPMILIGWLAEIDILCYVGLGGAGLLFGTAAVMAAVEKLVDAWRKRGLSRLLIAGVKATAVLAFFGLIAFILTALTMLIPLYVSLPWVFISVIVVWCSPNLIDQCWSNAKRDWRFGNRVQSVFMFGWTIVLSLFLVAGLLLKIGFGF